MVPELKAESTVSARGRWLNLRNGLVAAQVAVSLVLLVAAGLFLRSLARARAADPGFDPTGTAVLSFDLGSSGFDEARGRDFYDRLLERVRALPGIQSATLAQEIPLASCCNRRGTRIEGYAPRPGESTETNWNIVGTEYFQTLRIPIVQGRSFAEADRPGAPLVAIVNQAFARRYWPGQDPLGKRVRLSGPEGPATEVVGVARDGKYRSLGEDPLPFLYVPAAHRKRCSGSTPRTPR